MGRGYINKQAALDGLKTGRDAAIQVCIQAKVNSDEYRAASQTVEAIDDLVEALIGDREHFWDKMAPAQTSRG